MWHRYDKQREISSWLGFGRELDAKMIGTWKAKKDLYRCFNSAMFKTEIWNDDERLDSNKLDPCSCHFLTWKQCNISTEPLYISDWRHLSLSSHHVILLIYLSSQGTVWSNHWNRAKHLILPSGGLNMCQGWYQQQCDCQKNCFQGQEMKTAKMVHCMIISSLWM